MFKGINRWETIILIRMPVGPSWTVTVALYVTRIPLSSAPEWVKGSLMLKMQATTSSPLTHTVFFSDQRISAWLSFGQYATLLFKSFFVIMTTSLFDVVPLSRETFILSLCRRLSESGDKGWFRSLFVHKVDARKDAHSNLLSKRETSNLYKIQCRHEAFYLLACGGLFPLCRRLRRVESVWMCYITVWLEMHSEGAGQYPTSLLGSTITCFCMYLLKYQKYTYVFFIKVHVIFPEE